MDGNFEVQTAIKMQESDIILRLIFGNREMSEVAVVVCVGAFFIGRKQRANRRFGEWVYFLSMQFQWKY